MPSDIYETLCRQLREVNSQVSGALLKEDDDALHPLLHLQGDLRRRLEAAGPCKDSHLLPLLAETRDEMRITAFELESRRDHLAGRLKASGIKRKITDAYGK